MLVLADKNLVPNPRDNLTRVADILRKSGALPGCWGSALSVYMSMSLL
jgi:hypothetical protein